MPCSLAKSRRIVAAATLAGISCTLVPLAASAHGFGGGGFGGGHGFGGGFGGGFHPSFASFGSAPHAMSGAHPHFGSFGPHFGGQAPKTHLGQHFAPSKLAFAGNTFNHGFPKTGNFKPIKLTPGIFKAPPVLVHPKFPPIIVIKFPPKFPVKFPPPRLLPPVLVPIPVTPVIPVPVSAPVLTPVSVPVPPTPLPIVTASLQPVEVHLPAPLPVPSCGLVRSDLSITFQPSVSTTDIATFLKAYNVVMADGPNADGLYRVRLPDPQTSQTDVDQVVASMQSQTGVIASVTTQAAPSLPTVRTACGTYVSVTFVPTITSTDVTNFLKGYNVTMANGTNPDGSFTLRLSDGTMPKENVDAIIASMRTQTAYISAAASL